jgi:hypothetical protein
MDWLLVVRVASGGWLIANHDGEAKPTSTSTILLPSSLPSSVFRSLDAHMSFCACLLLSVRSVLSAVLEQFEGAREPPHSDLAKAILLLCFA